MLYGSMKYPDDLGKLMTLVAQAKQVANVMDFDDLLANANRILVHPDNTFRPQWIVVDEFQDCSREQIAMLHNMMDDSSSIFAIMATPIN